MFGGRYLYYKILLPRLQCGCTDSKCIWQLWARRRHNSFNHPSPPSLFDSAQRSAGFRANGVILFCANSTYPLYPTPLLTLSARLNHIYSAIITIINGRVSKCTSRSCTLRREHLPRKRRLSSLSFQQSKVRSCELLWGLRGLPSDALCCLLHRTTPLPFLRW